MEKIKILLADDHPIFLDGLRAYLRDYPDIEVAAFALNGSKVLDLLKETPVDIAVLDLRMPVMDGLEVAKTIREKFPKTRIILLTMEKDGQFILKAMKMGIQGYLLKEKSGETLVQAIRQVYDGASYFSPDLFSIIADLGKREEAEKEEQVQLTKREKQIICLMAKHPQFTAKEIAAQLSIDTLTVQKHIQNAKEKLCMRKVTELVMYAVEKNLCGA